MSETKAAIYFVDDRRGEPQPAFYASECVVLSSGWVSARGRTGNQTVIKECWFPPHRVTRIEWKEDSGAIKSAA